VTKVGTPVNNQIGVWTGDGTLEGDAAFTFDTSTDTLTVPTLVATESRNSTAVPSEAGNVEPFTAALAEPTITPGRDPLWVQISTW